MPEGLRSPDRRWTAVVERDAAADGAFLYAVRTTGVVCRPGCASRTPKREHVVFFDTLDQALGAGFRPCRRCTPGERSPKERFAAQVVRACRRLEDEEPEPTLEALAAEAGLSRAHFQRAFKQAVGLTPKQYARTRRAKRFRAGLARAGSVIEAIYDAGFGSSSRAYEGQPSWGWRRRPTATAALGWRSATASLRARSVGSASRRRSAACARSSSATTRPHSVRRLRDRFPGAELEAAGPGFVRVLERVVAFVEAPARALELPLDIRGTAFQQRVWDALRQVPPGRTVGYAELAARIGRPEAARAVAGACAANALAVAIPCHRVVRADGQLSGYRWGVERKRALLERERAPDDAAAEDAR